jgi:hypothetical protein
MWLRRQKTLRSYGARDPNLFYKQLAALRPGQDLWLEH